MKARNYPVIPKQADKGRLRQFDIGMLENDLNHHLNELQMIQSGCDFTPRFDQAERYACGLPLPDFQRDDSWTEGQSSMFIESCFMGYNDGSYVVHATDYTEDGKIARFSGWLIDGQHRLRAIEQFLKGELGAFGYGYSELSPADQRRFLNIGFPRREVELWDETLIRDLYNRLAFGGTPHTSDQMAKL